MEVMEIKDKKEITTVNVLIFPFISLSGLWCEHFFLLYNLFLNFLT